MGCRSSTSRCEQSPVRTLQGGKSDIVPSVNESWSVGQHSATSSDSIRSHNSSSSQLGGAAAIAHPLLLSPVNQQYSLISPAPICTICWDQQLLGRLRFVDTQGGIHSNHRVRFDVHLPCLAVPIGGSHGCAAPCEVITSCSNHHPS